MIRIQRADEVESAFFAPRVAASQNREAVRAILDGVREKGDAALREYSLKFDGTSPDRFELPREALEGSARRVRKENPALYDALCYSRDLALSFAEKQKAAYADFETEVAPGVIAGQKNIPVERAGLYVPAGRFPLLSSVIMTSAPARAAGVGEIILCTPPKKAPDGSESPYADEGIMAAAAICGVNRVFAVGGAQAIAAMAFGTESIPQVDVIAGPGNAFVAEAKRAVYGEVGIDMVAGPTEVFIIADDSADPAWVAADLLAQAEHDVASQAILACLSEDFAHRVQSALERELATLPTRDVAGKSIDDFGRIIICSSLEEAAALANRKAPEHLELSVKDEGRLSRLGALVHSYGSLFIGCGAAEVLGDYAAGINHTLPTGGSARFTGGLSVRAFIKTVTTLKTDNTAAGARRSLEAARRLGEAEGLAGHAAAARIRLGRPGT